MSDPTTAPDVPPDHTSLFETVASIRAQHRPDDPASLYYGRPDLIAKSEANIAALLARAGITEPAVETPAQRAERELAAAWPSVGAEISDHTQALLDGELDKLAELSPAQLEREIGRVAEEVGHAAYTTLVERAKGVTGGDWRPAMGASLATLRVLNGVATYREAHGRAMKARGK